MFTNLSENLKIALAGIFALLSISSIIVALLVRVRPQADFTELKQRVQSWWVMAIIFALALSLSRTVSVVFLALVSFLALKEYLSLIPTRRADRRVLLLAYLSIPLQYTFIGLERFGFFIITVPVYMLLLIPALMVLIGETRGFLRAVGTLHWGLMMTVFSVGHAAFLLVLPAQGNPNGGGPGLLLFLVLLTQLNDVAQYLWGKSIGGSKALPTVSPGKTQAGLAGGVLTTTALAWLLAPWLTPLTGFQSLVAGFAIGVAGFLGDVTVSAVKRDLGIKDSGTLLPGHGGILDRIDSLTYTAPVFFHYVYYLHY